RLVSTSRIDRITRDAERALSVIGDQEGKSLCDQVRSSSLSLFSALCEERKRALDLGFAPEVFSRRGRTVTNRSVQEQWGPRSNSDSAVKNPLPREVFTGEMEKKAFALDNALDALSTRCLRLAHGPLPSAGKRGEILAQLARRARRIRDDLSMITEGGGSGHITWLES